MKKNLSLSIPKACSEKWSNFTPATNGSFCGSCSKVVVDFTKMNDDQIIQYFEQTSHHTCGRFRLDQLKDYTTHAPLSIHPGMMLLKAGIISLLLVAVGRPGSAQSIPSKPKSEMVQFPDKEVVTMGKVLASSTHNIKGIVRSMDDSTPLPGANVVLKGSSVGTVTDADGRFEFPQQLTEGDILIFSYIGYDTQEYVVPKNATEGIEIVMNLGYCVMMGAVAVDKPYTMQSGFHKLWSKVKGLF